MSQYIHIFARQNDQFVPLYSESRCGYLYHALQDFAPYDKVVALTSDRITSAIQELTTEISKCDDQSAYTKELISSVGSFTNSIDEKIQTIGDLLVDIKNLEEEKVELHASMERLIFLKDIALSMASSVEYDNGAKDLGLYMGIECGEHITTEDIEKRI